MNGYLIAETIIGVIVIAWIWYDSQIRSDK